MSGLGGAAASRAVSRSNCPSVLRPELIKNTVDRAKVLAFGGPNSRFMGPQEKNQEKDDIARFIEELGKLSKQQTEG